MQMKATLFMQTGIKTASILDAIEIRGCAMQQVAQHDKRKL